MQLVYSNATFYINTIPTYIKHYLFFKFTQQVRQFEATDTEYKLVYILMYITIHTCVATNQRHRETYNRHDIVTIHNPYIYTHSHHTLPYIYQYTYIYLLFRKSGIYYIHNTINGKWSFSNISTNNNLSARNTTRC